jgi:integrase
MEEMEEHVSANLAIVAFQGDPLAGARGWTELNPEERRRRAVLAAQHLDRETLWSLTEAHVSLYGSAGVKMSVRTRRSYREGVGKFLDHAENTGVGLIRPERDAGPLYIRTLEANGLSPSSVRVHLASVRALFRALRWAGATVLDPFSDARPAKDKTAAWDKRQPYTDDEVQAMIKMAAPRDRALILLCAHGGLRIEEALSLEWNDVDLPGAVLTVKHGKGGKQRRVSLTPSLVTSLRSLPQTGLVIGASQTAARQRLRIIAEHARTRYLGWHAFRHYAGTRIVKQTGNLEYAARHLGHSSIETTRVYAKWSDRALDDALASW